MTESHPPYYCVAYLELVEQDDLLNEITAIPLAEQLTELMRELLAQTFGAVSALRNAVNDFLQPNDHLHHDISSWPQEYQDAFIHTMASQIVVRTFGYSIIAYIPIERQLPLPIGNVFSIFRLTAAIAMLSPKYSFSVRGGIAYNWGAILDNGDIYGPAYYEAYKLTHIEDDYPRIRVSNKLVDYLISLDELNLLDFSIGLECCQAADAIEFSRQCRQLLYRDNDSYYIDYISELLLREYQDHDLLNEAYRLISGGYDFFVREIARSAASGNIEREQRYAGMKRYYDSRRQFWDNSTIRLSLIQENLSPLPVIDDESSQNQSITHATSERIQVESDIHLMYYCVAFIDFLGQRNLLKDMANSKIEDITKDDFLQLRSKSFDAIEKLRAILAAYVGGTSIGVQFISDAVVLYIPLEASYTSLDQVTNIFTLLSTCAAMIPFMLRDGLVLRGGIEVNWGGELAVNDLYGPAVREAAMLESAAGNPRILIGNNLIDYLQQRSVGIDVTGDVILVRDMAMRCLDAISPDTDTDNRPILDYLGEFYQTAFLPAHRQRLTNDILPAALQFAREQEEYFISRNAHGLASKYEYIRQYLISRFPIN